MSTADIDPATLAAIARSLGRRGYGWLDTVEKIHLIFQAKILDAVIDSREGPQTRPYGLRVTAGKGWAEGMEMRYELAKLDREDPENRNRKG